MTGRRYLTLDGIRGLAALAVFSLHAHAVIDPLIMPHAYLAVDLFFLLSGFVIDHAYGVRLATGMTPLQFIVARYVRIYPLYLIGFLIGATGAALALMLGAGSMGWRDYLLALGSGLLMLPSPTVHADAMLVPFNYPAWSLLSEMAINIVYAFTWRWWRLPFLPIMIAASGILLWGYQQSLGSVDFGTAWVHGEMGLIRVLFSFSCGVLLRRLISAKAWQSDAAFLVPIAVGAALLGIIPARGDIILIILLLPIIIILGVMVEPRHGRLFAFLGTISYPVYVIHIPLIQLYERASTVLGFDGRTWAPWPGLVLMGFVMVAALILDRWYDVPVRRWLSKRLIQRPSRIDRGL